MTDYVGDEQEAVHNAKPGSVFERYTPEKESAVSKCSRWDQNDWAGACYHLLNCNKSDCDTCIMIKSVVFVWAR